MRLQLEGLNMRSKVAVLMSVIFLVVASLLVSGCTTSTTNQTPGSNVTSSAAAQHVNSTSAGFLEKYLTTYKNDTGDGNWSVTAWEVTWINSTSVRLQDTWLNNTSGVTESWEETVTVFPTSQDATNYLNATNLTAYSLASTEYGSEGAYLTVRATHRRFTKCTYGTREIHSISQNISSTR